jgi:hypothetical protein
MKKISLISLFVAVVAISGWNFSQNRNKVVLSDVALDNVEALAVELGSGICYGTGANWTNVYCYGGGTICCWAHTDVFGKN